MSARPPDLLGSLLADVEALEGAACSGAPVEFVDVRQEDAENLVRSWCWQCTTTGRCRAVGDALAPHEHGTVMGGRYYAARASESVAVLARRSA